MMPDLNFVSAVLSISGIAAITNEIPGNLDAQEKELNKCEITLPKWIKVAGSTFIYRMILGDLAACICILYFKWQSHWLLELFLLLPYFLVVHKFIVVSICFALYLYRKESDVWKSLKYLWRFTLRERLDFLREKATENTPAIQEDVNEWDFDFLNEIVPKCDVEEPENNEEVAFWAKWDVEIVR